MTLNLIQHQRTKPALNAKWRSWIKECLRSASISVLINGCPSRQFGMTKGLRQGDPLSPLLFLIVAEGLNGLISEAVKQGLFEGVKIGNGELKLAHLQFADDTLIMGKATKENIWVVKCIMRCFELVSGLKINYAKSQLMSTNVEKEWTTEMAYLLNCKIGKIPFKYLGTHVGGNSRSISHWKGLVETFEKKLSGWKGRYLSMGGRITLVNSVLSSLPVFQMSTHLLPKGTLFIIDSIRRRFLWGSCENNKKINWVKWEKVCKGKEEGGLGIKDLRCFNIALLGKWWVKLSQDSSSLWARVIGEKYGRKARNWISMLEERKGRGSVWWQNIRKLNSVVVGKEGWLLDNVKLELGEGKRVNKIWLTKWAHGLMVIGSGT
ncbi:hypothetical protein SLEP1_g53092 [Rubroshorea leprosula]|uniref:Reverse transcriptase domain-containing protein n=1 Tax=Rubroshorea leprosula TaxID=152421 RepID=A0AAV5M963_9ROSI|nr:hypothetical protein SLEP1_g53092 [Rubroshorea leprosula]